MNTEFAELAPVRPAEVDADIEKIIPLYDKVVIQRIEALGITKGGILIPELAKRNNRPQEAIVIAVGHGRWAPGQPDLQPLAVKVGDRVLFTDNGQIQEMQVKGGLIFLIIPEVLIISKVVPTGDNPVAALLSLVIKMHPALARLMLEQIGDADVTQYTPQAEELTVDAQLAVIEEATPLEGAVVVPGEMGLGTPGRCAFEEGVEEPI